MSDIVCIHGGAPVEAAQHPIDWAAIEADFRAGLKSVRLIAKEHNLTEGAIRKRAKRDNWARDLAATIRQTATVLARSEVRNQTALRTCVPDDEIVEANAVVVAAVMRGQETFVRRQRRVGESLLVELELTTTGQKLIEEMAALVAQGDEVDRGALIGAWQNLMALPKRIDAFRKLTQGAEAVIRMERAIFGLDAAGPAVDQRESVDSVTEEQLRQLENRLDELAEQAARQSASPLR